MSAYPRTDDEEAPLDPAAERLRRKMVRLLVVSGGIMVLGFIAVFAALVYKLGLLGQAGLASGDLGAAAEAVIPLPAGARLVATQLDGSRALLQVEAADGATTLVFIDLDSGRVLGRYELVDPETNRRVAD